ncbi:efflux RND transporter periplasmic adaptor subunit [Nostoc sp. TCL26-01]|uniref:efflux RND transporter periplasmic adaptor subunit n=1 Tax=Nostoc sp. TCL26-01 TaxID=2576904 RepID=UPI0015BAD1EF|nr:efflux RND transporter periplasmic adaptor subunit [Nostoc sp. TCL26-01]
MQTSKYVVTRTHCPLPIGRLWLIILGLTYFCTGCVASEAQSNEKDAGKKRPVSVVVAIATPKTVPMLFSATGNVEAYSTVSVKSKVGGQLTGVYFRQGQKVKQGDLLFTIDSRPLQALLMQAQANKVKDLAQVKQAQANLEKAKAQVQQAQANVEKAKAQVNQAKANVVKDVAQATNANSQAQRYANLLKQGAISKQQAEDYQTSANAQKATVTADQGGVANAQAAVVAALADVQNAQASVVAAQADVQNAQAVVAADQAAIDNAQVQLSYSSIYSPINGRTGSLKLNQGNLVKADADDPLITISQIHPIYVTFSIPQRLLPDLNKYNTNHKLEVDALVPKDPRQSVRGELTFVDSGVNPQTGTIQLKATFTNADERLVPGQFVNVVLKFTEEPNAITVPAPAVQTGQKGQFVYVVKSDKKVEVRPVIVGDTVESATVIKQGLQPGEQVVVDGQFNLVPGARVQVKPAVGSRQQS